MVVSLSSGKGSYFEHLFAFLKVLEGLIDTKNDFKPDITSSTKIKRSTKTKKMTR
jgi:hypothetical protein